MQPISRWLVVLACLSGGVASGQEDDLTRRASWSAPSAGQVKAELDKWLASRDLTEDQQKKIAAVWEAADDESASDPTLNLQRLVESAGLVWPEAAQVVDVTNKLQVQLPVAHFDILAEPVSEQSDPGEGSEENEGSEDNAEPANGEAEANGQAEQEVEADPDRWVRNNLRLHYARWLAQHELYDESLDLIRSLKPDDVVDPASLLFYQSAAYHFLLNKTEGLATIEKLLENEENIPRRYSLTASLMAADLKPLKTDSLDEIARLMDDIERRLRLQRAGKRVRQEEDDVVAKLDKMIEELEKQQKEGQPGGGAGNSNNPSQPMQESQIGGGPIGEGNVDPKQLAAREGWGNLPPKERQEALQQITKDLPAHYREAVEEYFRKLARDGANP